MKKTVHFIDENKQRIVVDIEVSTDGVGTGKKLDYETVLPVEGEIKRLSMSGSCGGGFGQMQGSIAPATEGQRELVAMWEAYHLNDVHAGTKRQEDFLGGEGKIYIKAIQNALVDAGYPYYIKEMMENNLVEMTDYNVYRKLQQMAPERLKSWEVYKPVLKVTRGNGKVDYFRVGEEKKLLDAWVAELKDKWLKDNGRKLFDIGIGKNISNLDDMVQATDEIRDMFAKRDALRTMQRMKIDDLREFAKNYDDYTGAWKGSDTYELKKLALIEKGLYSDRGYLYGHAWLYKNLPASIENDIETLCAKIVEENIERSEELSEELEMDNFEFNKESDYDIRVKVGEYCGAGTEKDWNEDTINRFIALGKALGEDFISLYDSFEEVDSEEQRYSYGGDEYYIGTSEELESVCRTLINADDEYKNFWQQAVEAGITESGFAAWREEVVTVDGFAHTLDRYDGEGTMVTITGKEFWVCKA